MLLKDLDEPKVRDQSLRLRVVKDLGVILIDSGDYQEANSYLQTALEWAQDIGDVSGLVSIYNSLGAAYRALGDLESATAYIQKALATSDAVQDLTAAAVLHNTLAVIAAERRHYTAAKTHVDRAIQIGTASGPAYNVPHFMCTKAELELKQGLFDAAMNDAEDALAEATRVGNKRAGAAAMLVLADVSLARELPQEAERRLEEAATTYKSLGAKAELGETYMRISKSMSDRGDMRNAQKYSDLAFKAAKKISALVDR